MSKYYNPNKAPKPYSVVSKEPFSLSRTKIDAFIKCQRCFYLDVRCGVAQPPGYPFTLNVAVDALLKKEFDVHRAAKTAHPFMEAYGLNAVPFQHPKMDIWRDPQFGRGGIRYVDPATNFDVYGAVDDIWVNPDGELIVVDYKATSKATEPTLDGDLGVQYQRQMEVYQWLLRKNGFKVSKTGYFVYVNGNKDAKAFDKKLEFNVSVLPCLGETSWIEQTLLSIRKALEANEIPAADSECDYCNYRFAAAKVEKTDKEKPVILPKKPKEPKEGSLF